MLNKLVFIFLILFELIIVLFLIIKIYYKKSNIFNIALLKKENMIFSNKLKIKNFYEPKPNSIQKDPQVWLKHIPIYTINKDGLNDRFDYNIDKKNGTYRIVTLGDSFTFGQFVNTEDNWTELLEEEINQGLKCKKKIEILNLGVYGYDLAYSVARYLSRGAKYKSDLVLFFIKDDDFSEIKDITAQTRWDYINNLKSQGKYDSMIKKGTTEINIESYKIGMQELYKKYTKTQIIDYQLSALKNLINNTDKLFVFNISKFKFPVSDKIKDLIQTNKNDLFVEQLGDIDKKLTKNRYTFLPFDLHPNEIGHQLIANTLFEYIKEKNILSCSNQ